VHPIFRVLGRLADTLAGPPDVAGTSVDLIMEESGLRSSLDLQERLGFLFRLRWLDYPPESVLAARNPGYMLVVHYTEHGVAAQETVPLQTQIAELRNLAAPLVTGRGDARIEDDGGYVVDVVWETRVTLRLWQDDQSFQIELAVPGMAHGGDADSLRRLLTFILTIGNVTDRKTWLILTGQEFGEAT